MLKYAFNPSTGRQKQADLCEASRKKSGEGMGEKEEGRKERKKEKNTAQYCFVTIVFIFHSTRMYEKELTKTDYKRPNHCLHFCLFSF